MKYYEVICHTPYMGEDAYHYFLFEPIRWRVLHCLMMFSFMILNGAMKSQGLKQRMPMSGMMKSQKKTMIILRNISQIVIVIFVKLQKKNIMNIHNINPLGLTSKRIFDFL